MVKLTDEKRVVDKDSKHLKKGDIVDDSVYLVRIDNNNLALKRGDTILNYFGDVKTALKRSVNYAVKGSVTEMSLELMANQIESIHRAIEGLEGREI